MRCVIRWLGVNPSSDSACIVKLLRLGSRDQNNTVAMLLVSANVVFKRLRDILRGKVIPEEGCGWVS